jgi:hypothetical protein
MAKRYVPHAVICTERSVPSPIFAAAICGVERLLRLELDASLPAATYMRQALKQVPEHVLAFGRSVGVVVNYRPDFAVKYDLKGMPVETLDKAVSCGTAYLATLH